MLQFNNNHIFTGYLKQFLSSFNLPTCKVYTAEFEKFYAEHGYEDPRVLDSNTTAAGITYLKDGTTQQYFRDTRTWKSNKALHYNGNKILGLTRTLKNPTTLYNYQTHEYLGDYLRFLRDFENINLMSMYNCFSNRFCNNIKKLELKWEHQVENFTTRQVEKKTRIVTINSYDNNYKIYMLPVKLFASYTIAIDCYQGVELFCGFYNEKLDTSDAATNIIKKTYIKVSKALFNQPFIYDKLSVEHWSLENTNKTRSTADIITEFSRSDVAVREDMLKLFIKIPATNTSSIVVLEGDYRNFNDSLYKAVGVNTWQYECNSTVANFETNKTDKQSNLPNINSREFKPISKLQLLALNTGISYPFADRLIEYLVANVILPNDPTTDNIKRLQKVMEDCGYGFQIDGIWEPKMQMILYDYLMNSGKFTIATEPDKNGNDIKKVKNNRAGNLKQIGQKMRSDFYDILGYVDKDAEKLYASWTIETVAKNGQIKPQVIAKNTLENVDIYNNLYNN